MTQRVENVHPLFDLLFQNARPNTTGCLSAPLTSSPLISTSNVYTKCQRQTNSSMVIQPTSKKGYSSTVFIHHRRSRRARVPQT